MRIETSQALGLNVDTVPLVVDLDGTLIKTDLLHEAIIAYLMRSPCNIFRMAYWLLFGKAYLKTKLTSVMEIEVSVLPYDSRIVDMIQRERSRNRTIVLATGSHETQARMVAAHLGNIDEVIATSDSRNLSGRDKREVLVDRFGIGGYDYVGNSLADVPVWRSSRRRYMANAFPGLKWLLRGPVDLTASFQREQSLVSAAVQEMRPHQWAKNVLVVVPLLAAHRATDSVALLSALGAFACFCLCASALYVLNDLVDLTSDRHHESKNQRPIAAGNLPVSTAVLLLGMLGAGAAIVAVFALPPLFTLVLAGYVLLSATYSLVLKKLVAVDVVGLALLYTLRVIAGALAISVAISFWLLAFSMFMFLSLAFVKRYSELHGARDLGEFVPTPGRGYVPRDLEAISSLGTASGYISVMVLALYINDDATRAFYSNPQIIWAVCPLLLLWLSRVWFITCRGQMHDDPVVFALTDRFSLSVAVLMAMAFWLAI